MPRFRCRYMPLMPHCHAYAAYMRHYFFATPWLFAAAMLAPRQHATLSIFRYAATLLDKRCLCHAAVTVDAADNMSLVGTIPRYV